MGVPELYRNRIPTFIKHEFLRAYLERLTFKTLSSFNEFAYVDGFSGPWQASGENLEDTSFVIALDRLRRARDEWNRRGRDTRIKCVFVEKRKDAFERLRASTTSYPDVDILAIHGRFEENIAQIVNFVGRAFVFVFVDPTGWSVDTRKIAPLLRHRPSEVVFNFMFDFANRFVGDHRIEIMESFNPIFAGSDWRQRLRPGIPESEAIVELMGDVLREHGEYDYIAFLEVLHGTSERTKYFLHYGTRKFVGLVVFREVQKRISKLQETTRRASKQEKKVENTGQGEMFSADTSLTAGQNEEHLENLAAARSLIVENPNGSRVEYESMVAPVLERCALTQPEVNRLLQQLRSEGVVAFEGLKAKERTPKKGHFIVVL